MKFLKTMLLGALLSVTLLSNAQAREQFAVGIQHLYFSSNLSGKFFIDDRMGAQLLIGTGAYTTDLGARFLYQIQEHDNFNYYAAVGAMYRKYSFLFVEDTYYDVNVAGGVEVNWQKWIDDIFPLWWSIELGTGFTDYTTGMVRIHSGLHYRF